MPVRIDKENQAKMFQHSIEEYPYECCGIITGSSDLYVHRCTNIQNRLHEEDPIKHPRDSRIAYFIDPEEQYKIITEAEEKGQEIKGFYHSHPDGGAYFSQEDTQRALFFDEPAYGGAFYIVISVTEGKVQDARCFAWNEKERTFEEVGLEAV